MAKYNRLFMLSIGVGLFIVLAAGNLLRLPGPASASARPVVQTGELVLLAWNDLGMHCYNSDFADLAVLPPYNTLWAQVVQAGNPPEIVTQGITVSYEFKENTESASKTNFWEYAQVLFGLPAPLPANIGLTGKGLAGEMDLEGDHFVAEGIPLTEFSDSAPTTPDPYQLATITVQDAETGEILAQTEVVAPVSSEMRCDRCHDDTGIATVGEIQPTGRTETNILALHDEENQEDYPPGHETPLMDRRPVLCAECHASNALGAAGVDGIPNLSRAIHDQHEDEVAETTDGCYNCHPGPQTKCLRDVMSQAYGMGCTDCHGKMEQVAHNPDPWLNEPRCDECHGPTAVQDQPLYRMSRGHSGLYCEGCHDSTHAIAPSRELADGLKFAALQGDPGMLKDCTVCHVDQPEGEFPHSIITSQTFRIFLPGIHSR